MNKYRYIVTWSYQGGLVWNKIYKYRKPAFKFANKLNFLTDAEITVEYQERKGEEWVMQGRWLY